MSRVFQVASLLNCSAIIADSNPKSDPLFQQTSIGCKLLNILEGSFNISFEYEVRGTGANLSSAERRLAVHPRPDDIVDLYAKPLALVSGQILEYAYPIEGIFIWRCGFILLREDYGLFHAIYSRPFSGGVWAWLFLMLFISSAVFHVLVKWERKLGSLRGDCCLINETLITIGAYCQIILPLETRMSSRRIAYITFFVFAFIINAFYNSNLLSHLVSDRENTMTMDDLANSDYTCAVMDSMVPAVKGTVPPSARRLFQEKLSGNMSIMNLTTGLEAVRTGRVALLVDYMTMYPIIRKEFTDSEICQVAEVDLYSGMKKYMFSSKKLSLIDHEKLKVSILRVREAGLLKRLTTAETSNIRCSSLHHVSAQISHVINPLIILACAHVLSGAILFYERLHFKRHHLWPYLE